MTSTFIFRVEHSKKNSPGLQMVTEGDKPIGTGRGKGPTIEVWVLKKWLSLMLYNRTYRHPVTDRKSNQ